jgi:hypothetical protein
MTIGIDASRAFLKKKTGIEEYSFQVLKHLRDKLSDEKVVLYLRPESLSPEKYGFEIIRIGNSEKKDFQKSVIYDLTFGEKMDALKILKEKTNANVSFNIPDWLKENIKEDLEIEENPEQPDFLLILGQDTPK